jgi:hypothetical protein
MALEWVTAGASSRSTARRGEVGPREPAKTSRSAVFPASEAVIRLVVRKAVANFCALLAFPAKAGIHVAADGTLLKAARWRKRLNFSALPNCGSRLSPGKLGGEVQNRCVIYRMPIGLQPRRRGARNPGFRRLPWTLAFAKVTRSAMAFLLIAAAALSQAAASPPIAQVKTVAGQVVIERSAQRLPAKVGDPLFEQDVVETGPDGAIGITFIDNTVFSTGPNSQLALDEFQFDSNNFRGSMLADMRQGTLAVVSGDITRSAPGAMKIKTPTAVLGVRGTTFAVQVYGDH